MKIFVLLHNIYKILIWWYEHMLNLNIEWRHQLSAMYNKSLNYKLSILLSQV